MLRIKSMYEHNLYSLRYLCTFSYSKNNSKFTGSLLKIYVCDVNKTLLSMKVALFRKNKIGTLFGSYLISFLYINVISVLCNPNGTLFQTYLILHVWLKSIILVFANILNIFFSFLSIIFISKHAIHNWFYRVLHTYRELVSLYTKCQK
jgi:hypothetical protein